MKGGEYMNTKKILSSIFVFALLVSIVAASTQVYAQSPTGTQHPNFFQGLVEMIAQKFGLDKAKVQSVVTDYQQQKKTERQNNMQERQKARLDQLVKEGKITSAQEQAIITELGVLRTKYNPANMKGLTPDQRKDQIQAMQNEIKAWAQSQGIDPTYLMPGGFMGRGMKGNGMRWGNK